MELLQDIWERARSTLGPLLGVLIIAYFAFHVVQGDRGLLAFASLSKQIKKAETTEGILAKERSTWENRVSLLRPERLDRDMLEERARVMLNYGRADEVMILD